MRYLNKKIGIVVLSVLILIGGALIVNANISNAYPLEHEIKYVINAVGDLCNPLDKNYIENEFNLYNSIIKMGLGLGVHQIGNQFFFN